MAPPGGGSRTKARGWGQGGKSGAAVCPLDTLGVAGYKPTPYVQSSSIGNRRSRGLRIGRETAGGADCAG
jgi:hypothetical protein